MTTSEVVATEVAEESTIGNRVFDSTILSLPSAKIEALAIKIANETSRNERAFFFDQFCRRESVLYVDALWEFIKPAVNKIRAQARAEAERKRLEIADAIMGRRYIPATFDTFIFLDVDSYGDAQKAKAIRRYQEYVVDEAREYALNIQEKIDSGTNLIFRGPSGTGKDHLASAIVKFANRLPPADNDRFHGERVAVCTGPSLFAAIRNSMKGGSEHMVIHDLTMPSILVLSDPVLTGSAEHTSFQRDVLFRIVDQRVAEMKPIITTINASDDDEMSDLLGEQIAGRLLGDATVLECHWPSYRKPAKVVRPV